MINRAKKILKNKDNKVLLENFFSLSTLQIVGLILPLFTLPYVLRVIGFGNYGTIALAVSLIAYLKAVTDYSFLVTAVRDLSIFRSSQKKINYIYSKVMTVKFIFLFLSLLIITLIVESYEPFSNERIIFYLVAGSLFGDVLFPQWFFQGIEKMKFLAIIKVLVQIIFTFCIFFFIKTSNDYWIYPLLSTSGSIMSGLIAQIVLIKNYKVKFSFLPLRVIKKTIFNNFPIFTNQFLPTLYNNTSTFLLGFFVTTEFVGIYAAIRKIIDISTVGLRTVSQVFFPYLNRNQGEFIKYRNLMLVMTVVVVFSLLVAHPIIFYYLNINHQDDLLILSLLSFSLFGFSFYNIYGLNYFLIKRMDKLVMKNTIFTSIFGFVLAFPLIFYFGIIGAAASLLLSRIIMGGGLYIQVLIFEKKPNKVKSKSSVV